MNLYMAIALLTVAFALGGLVAILVEIGYQDGGWNED